MEVQDNPYEVLWYQKSSFIQVLVIAHCQVKKILLELLEPMSAACRGAEMFSDTTLASENCGDAYLSSAR